MNQFTATKRTKYLLVVIIFLCGCASLTPGRLAKFMLPVNATAAYFGSVALHESGHYIAAKNSGGRHVTIDVLPSMHNEVFYFGRTEATFNTEELTVFHTMGPAASFVQPVTFRSALRSGHVPKYVQPICGWFDVFGRISSYYHTVLGLVGRPKHMDLCKEDRWIAGAFLIGNVIYDVGSWLLSEDDFETYFGVLFGEKFYGMENTKR